MRSRASRRYSSNLSLNPSKEDPLDDLDLPVNRHRHRRRKTDQPSNANRSSTQTYAIPAKPKKSRKSPVSSEYPISGFFPRLSRILEHKDEEATSRDSEPPTRTNREPKLHYRRSDATKVDRERAARYRTYHLQQELSSLSNPSLTSLFSTLTTSSGSSGSSTVTQRSYDKSVGIHRKRRLKHRSRRERIPPEGRDYLKLSKTRRSDSMDPVDSHVGTIQEEIAPARDSKLPSRSSLRGPSSATDHDGDDLTSTIGKPASLASSHATSSSEDEDIGEGENTENTNLFPRVSSRASSIASNSHDEETRIDTASKPPRRARSGVPLSNSNGNADEPEQEVATTAAERKSFPPSPSDSFMGKSVWKRQDTFNSDSGISVSSSPEVNTRLEQASKAQQSETEEADSDEESSDPSSSDEDEDEDGEETLTRPCPTARSSSTAITCSNLRSRALMDNDPLVKRLQEQEEEMISHMDLHSPRPQRKFRPPVTSPCEPSPALPLFDHRASSTVPAHFVLPPHAPDLPHRNGGFLHPQYSNAMPPAPPFHPDPTRKTVAGYEVLAEKLAQQSQAMGEGVWQPAYRKFAQLNHRILLHLQDEISVLEEELRMVDESIAQRAEIMEGEIPPASRRLEMRYGSEMHHRRTELLGRVFQKLGQYSMCNPYTLYNPLLTILE